MVVEPVAVPDEVTVTPTGLVPVLGAGAGVLQPADCPPTVVVPAEVEPVDTPPQELAAVTLAAVWMGPATMAVPTAATGCTGGGLEG